MLLHNATLKHEMNSDRTYADRSHWETDVYIQAKTVGNSEFFMIGVISLLPLTFSSQKKVILTLQSGTLVKPHLL